MPSLLNLKYSLRSLKQNKFTLFINIFGFSVSLAFVIMIGLYINREYSVDDFHVDKERIFRIDQANVDEYTGFPIQFAEDLAAAFPEVDKILRIVEGDVDIQIPTGERFVQRVMFTDNSLFSVFSFDLKEGDAGSVLLTQKDIVLSETFASRLFGSEPAVGKSLFMGADSMEYFTVSGVVRDFGNSHLVCPDVIMSLEYERNNKYMKPYYKGYQMWNSDTYVKAVRGSNLPAKQDEINSHFSKYTNALWSDAEKSNGAHIEIVPVADIYFTGRCGDFGRCNDKNFLSVMIVTALLILIFAGINYLNLSVSQSGFRAKSAAIQRLLGSSKGDMFWGFITESVGVCLVSGIISILLAWIAYPWFGSVMSADLAFGENVGWWGMVSFVAVILVIGALSGWIPATVISSFKPIEVARGTLRRKTKTVYSKVLITFQYTITTILLGCTIIIARQIDYMQNSDLGFDSENVIAFSYDRNNFTSRQSVEHTLRAIPGVENVSSCSDFPTSVQNSFIYRDKEDVVRYVQRFYADTNFVSVLGIPVLYEHVNNGYWFNETIAKRIGLTEESLVYADNGINATVKGVIKDFHIHDFSHAIDEIWIEPVGDDYVPDYILVRVYPENKTTTLKRVAEEYEKLGGLMFDGKFISDHVEALYVNQRRLSVMLGLLSFIAIVISSMGMLAMSIYFTRQRARDMAVRKVFGATPQGVLGLLMGGFLKLVGVAFVIAVPIIYLLMQEWLSGYAYRIRLTPVPFLIAGGIVLVIAVLTVVGHSVKVAVSNPVDSLKAE